MNGLAIPEGHRDLLRQLHAHLSTHDAPAWLVGGYVRDLFLGRTSADLDIAVDGDAPVLARHFADATSGSWVLLDADTGTARIVWPAEAESRGWPHTLDLVRLRAPTIQADLAGRDFTINALALSLDQLIAGDTSEPIDPLGGLPDLWQGLLRACSDHALPDDPLRMLRAVRLAAELKLDLAPELQDELRRHRQLIDRVSAERVRDELLKILVQPDAGHWIELLDDVRLLTTFVPELEPSRDCEQPNLHYLPVLGHLIEAVVAADWLIEQLRGQPRDGDESIAPDAVWAIPELRAQLSHPERILRRLDEHVDGVRRLALFKFAVLLHDVAKPQTKATKPDGGVSFYDHQTIGAEVAWSIARRLRLSRAACDYVRLIVREHMRPGQLSELGQAVTMRAIYRFFRATGDAGPEVLLHSLCDHLAMQGPKLNPAGWEWHVRWTSELLDIFYDQGETVRPEPILRGDDLISGLGLEPGPLIGRLLEGVREAQALGEIHTREEALEWARRAQAQPSTATG